MTEPTDLGLEFAASVYVARLLALDATAEPIVLANAVKEILIEYGQAVRDATREAVLARSPMDRHA